MWVPVPHSSLLFQYFLSLNLGCSDSGPFLTTLCNALRFNCFARHAGSREEIVSAASLVKKLIQSVVSRSALPPSIQMDSGWQVRGAKCQSPDWLPCNPRPRLPTILREGALLADDTEKLCEKTRKRNLVLLKHCRMLG